MRLQELKVIGIIPARYHSTRFPGKPLVNIGGKSMIRRVYEQATQVDLFSQVIVATDDMRILEHVDLFGGKAMMTSEKHLSGTDRCAEVINTLQQEYDVVVNIQGDEPFIQPAQLTQLIEAFQNPAVHIATLVKKIASEADVIDKNIVKVVFDKHQKALYFSRNNIPGNKSGFTDPALTAYYKHLGIYSYRSETLLQLAQLPQSSLETVESLEQLRWLENGFSIHVVETDMEAISIDTPADLEKIKS
jgi:3-deoxy-manno-octulosonate cytidylyltransferase (CMP-KDO synthetase)